MMLDIILLALGIAVALAIVVLSVIWPLIKKRQADPDAKGEENVEEKIETRRVTVTDLNCNVRAEGLFRARVVTEFFVTLLTDDGETILVSVDEERFDTLDTGMTGEVTLTNGVATKLVTDKKTDN
jgi:hypothetical protein